MLAASAYFNAGVDLEFAPHYELMQHLAINSGDIRSAGAIAIAGLLKNRHCTLQTLRLCSKNRIGAAGARALGGVRGPAYGIVLRLRRGGRCL